MLSNGTEKLSAVKKWSFAGRSRHLMSICSKRSLSMTYHASAFCTKTIQMRLILQRFKQTATIKVLRKLRPFVRDYLGEPVPEETFTHSHLSYHQSSFISFCHLLWSIASSLFNLCAWQSFCTISLQILFGLPLGLTPFTSYSIHFFTNHGLLFARHAHTIATCYAVVPRLCYLILVSLSTLYFELHLLP